MTGCSGPPTSTPPADSVVTAPLTQPDDWDTLVPERQAVIDAVVPAGDVFYVLSTDRSIAMLELHDRHDGRGDEVTLPDVGTFAGFDADPATGVAFLQLESFTKPPALHRVSAHGGVEAWGDAGEDAAVAFSVSHQTYASRDGTAIGLFLVHRADVEPSPARRPSSPATEASRLPPRPCGPRSPRHGASRAASSPSPASAVAPRRGRPGTKPACGTRSRTCSTTSHRRRTTSSPPG